MKIALVSPYDYAYPGGVVIHIYHLREQLIKLGHEVKIITPYSGDRASLEDGQDVITIGNPVSVPSGGSIARVPLSPLLAPKVRAILEQEGFDIIHLHEPMASTLTITILRLSQAINVGTFHAHHSSSWGYALAKPLAMRWFKKLHGKIAVSKAAMSFVGKHLPDDYVIIPNGIDVERFSLKAPQESKFNDDKLNILFVGRPEKRKGLKYLVGAYKIVKAEMPNTRLIVVGPGTKEKFEPMVRAMKLEDVVFPGYVDNDVLPTYYHAADVFCSPATGEESFGIILLEAMAASKSIVASNIEGYNSVMTPGVQGLMVPPKDEPALASALMELLKDEPRRREMGRKGLVKAEECSWPNVASAVNEYYSSLRGGS